MTTEADMPEHQHASDLSTSAEALVHHLYSQHDHEGLDSHDLDYLRAEHAAVHPTDPSKALDEPTEVTETFPITDGIALRLSFTPDAIRDHFDVEEVDPLEGMSEKDLLQVGAWALADDGLYQAFHHALTAAVEAVRTEQELDPVGQMGWQRVLGIADDVLPGETRDGHAGGTVIVRTYLPDGRNVIITDGDSEGEPFSGDATAERLYIGLYESTDAADEGADAIETLEEVLATERHLTSALLEITGLPAHLCDKECGNPTHPHDGLLTKEN